MLRHKYKRKYIRQQHLKLVTALACFENPKRQILRNVNTDGGVDTNITYLPIPPGTRLNSTASVYENHPVVLTKEDIVTEMTFTLGSNITNEVKADVLLNLVVSGIKEYN